jgi:DNA-binding NarL/FixJ family response regulator
MLKRILVADDSDTVRRVLRTYLTQQDLDVCGEAADGEDTIEQARKLKPDLILLDAAMPRTNGIVAASVLKEMMPNVRIVLFTMYSFLSVPRNLPTTGAGSPHARDQFVRWTATCSMSRAIRRRISILLVLTLPFAAD